MERRDFARSSCIAWRTRLLLAAIDDVYGVDIAVGEHTGTSQMPAVPGMGRCLSL